VKGVRLAKSECLEQEESLEGTEKYVLIDIKEIGQ
jgi:hypothetical protein